MLNLTALARAKGIRRREITFRPVLPAPGLATDLAAIYAPAWQVWRDATDHIMAGYEPAPLGDAVSVIEPAKTDGVPERFNGEGRQDGTPCTGLTCRGFESHHHSSLTLDSPGTIESAINAAAADFLTRVVIAITPSLRRWAARAEQVHRRRWIAAVNAGTGIDLSTILTAGEVSETVETFIARNVALAKNISDQAQSRIADAVFRGYQNRTPAREVAREIREATGMARDRSVRIAADQNSKLSAALDTERQLEAGLDKFKWRHSGKLHPRSWHQARNGKVYFIRSGKRVDGGETIPADDRAGRPPWCGCREAAYIDLMDEIE